MKYPSLLILNEKHGKWYYLLESQEDLTHAAITIVDRRLTEGWYDDLAEYDPEAAEMLDLYNQAEGGSIKQAKAAWELLHLRIESEYEGFDVEYFDNKKPVAIKPKSKTPSTIPFPHLTWKENSEGIFVALVTDHDGDSFELSWHPNDAENVGWAEYLIGPNRELVYGNSGFDSAEWVQEEFGKLVDAK